MNPRRCDKTVRDRASQVMISRKHRVPGPALVLLASLASCSSDGGRQGDLAEGGESLPRVTGLVAHRDERAAGAPTFVWLAPDARLRFSTASEAAKATVKALGATFRLDPRASVSVEPAGIDDAGVGPIVANFEQRDVDRGIEVFRGHLAVAMTRAFVPVSASGFLARSMAGAERPFARSPDQAVRDAHAALNRGRLDFRRGGRGDGQYDLFDAEGLAAPARVKKVLYPQGDGVVPAYYVELQIARGPAFGLVVSAADGQVLLTNDLVRADAFGYRVYADPETSVPFDGPQGNTAAPHPTKGPSGFRPTFGSSQLVTLQNFPFSRTDPWLPAGATTTAGNNVVAYADLHAPSGLSGDSAVSVSGPNLFDYAYDTAESPGATPTNVSGAVTHLFYVTNFLHDWYYDAGFNEAAGNPQSDNFGRGGIGRDALKAEAQDYDGRNNANATVPADGAAPRLQMYVFSGPSSAEIQVLSPGAVAGTKRTAIAGFGSDAFDVTGAVALASDDQGADAADGCEPLTANVAGKIALVHRGVCSFVQKAQNIQAAGAIGVIVTNVAGSAQASVPPFMGGTSATVTLPVLSLSLADGRALEAAIAAGAEVRLHREHATDLDGALDTTIVAHEWGHVMSGRLVGNGNGLTTNQSGGLGEGWADFAALLLMVRADDISSAEGSGFRGAYPNGAYATSGGGADFYFGIRRVPYSIDFAKDPLTLRHIQNGSPLPSDVPVAFGEDGSFNAEVHNAGEVWATMLWECYASLLRDPRYTFADAQTRMKRYFVASLKLTPPDPTLLEARDAVLAAALATDEGDYRLFWEAFARRGAGVGAEGPPKDSSTNQGVKESYSVANDVQIEGGTLTDDVVSCDHDGILDDSEVGTLTFSVRNAGPGVLREPVASLSSTTAGIRFLDGASIKLEPLEPFGKAQTVKVRVQASGFETVTPIDIAVRASDPSFGPGREHELRIGARVQADEAPDAAAVDHVDTTHTSWTVSGDETSATTKRWERVRTGLDGRWSVLDGFEVADQLLTSRAFTVEGSTFELAFKHRWSFRVSTRRKVDIDGGVVEVSVDGGKTWKDVSEFGAAGYNTSIDTGGRGDNPLKGRDAYGNKSPGYPDQWVTSRIKVDLQSQPESVKIRFHAASGTGFSSAPGWEIDDIELLGISSDPFWSFVDHGDYCDEKGPTANAGVRQVVGSKDVVSLLGSGSHPSDLPLTFGWTQLAGPSVTLVQDGSPGARFEAPDPGEPVTLSFELRANDGALLSAGSRVDVEVRPTRWQAGGAGCSSVGSPVPPPSSTSLVTLLGVLGLGRGLALRRRKRARDRALDLG